LAGVVLFVVFVLLAVHERPAVDADASTFAALSQMVTLEATSFIRPNRLLDDGEYRLLKSNPDLLEVAARLRKDRQKLALLWIDALLKDLDSLWRFRRFVIQRGAPAHLSEEWTIFRSFVGALFFLKVLRLSIVTLGPFAFVRITRGASRPVEAMSQAAARSLERIPSTGWSDVGRAWTRTAA
jgi:hypothetical protein